MTRDDWETILTFEEQGLIIGYPWHFVTDIVGDWTLLQLIADGSWSCLGDAIKPCGPNGHINLPLEQDRLLIAGSAPGALIGKFGGSVAGRTDGTAFAIGARCVVTMPAKRDAQLYIGVNGAIQSSANVLERIKLEICGVVDAES